MEAKLHKIIILGLVTFFAACNGGKTQKEGEEAGGKGTKGEVTAMVGEDLAKSYCASCHKYVPPSALDKQTWQSGIIPAMGPRMGIYSHRGVDYRSDKGLPNTEGIYPDKPMVTEAQWQAIIEFYIQNAPVKPLPQKRDVAYSLDLKGFSTKKIPSNNVSPIISLIKVDNGGGFYIYDANSRGLARMNGEGKTEFFTNIPNPVSSLLPYKKGYLIANIGSLMPSDVWKGQINYASVEGGNVSLRKSIRTEVERPVKLVLADLNGDKEDDIVVCGYGNNKGDYYWLDGKTFEKYPIKQIPGAITTQAVDYDKDGDMDLFTLFAQGTEQIVYFENDGKGTFKEKTIKEFIPVQGSTSIEIVDINKDGNLDILYTSGDNADHSVIFKNYHGVYIYLGDGKGNFEQSYFYPMNGAFKAMTSDFDGDGDLDIAAISFFANYVAQPYEGFLYFEQTGNMEFKVSTNPDTYEGRWLTMDVGDVDMDGDDDIVLGNFSIGPTSMPETIVKTWMDGPAAMILYNNRKIQ